MVNRWIWWFDELGLGDVAVVGGKNASLGDLRRALGPEGVRVPNGFATTAEAYRSFLRLGGLEPVIDGAMAGLDVRRIDQLQAAGQKIRRAILNAELPADLADALVAACAARPSRWRSGDGSC
jgi:pyruvate, water dikinase